MDRVCREIACRQRQQARPMSVVGCDREEQEACHDRRSLSALLPQSRDRKATRDGYGERPQREQALGRVEPTQYRHGLKQAVGTGHAEVSGHPEPRFRP